MRVCFCVLALFLESSLTFAEIDWAKCKPTLAKVSQTAPQEVRNIIKQVSRFDGHIGNEFLLSPDGQTLHYAHETTAVFGGSGDTFGKKFLATDLHLGKIRGQRYPNQSEEYITPMAFSPSGSLLAGVRGPFEKRGALPDLSLSNEQITLVDSSSGKEAVRIRLPDLQFSAEEGVDHIKGKQMVSHLAFEKDGKLLGAVDNADKIHVFNLGTKEGAARNITILPGEHAKRYADSQQANQFLGGKGLFAGTLHGGHTGYVIPINGDGTVKRVGSGGVEPIKLDHKSELTALTSTPDGQVYFAVKDWEFDPTTLTANSKLIKVDSATGKKTELPVEFFDVRNAKSSNDGTTLLVTGLKARMKGMKEEDQEYHYSASVIDAKTGRTLNSRKLSDVDLKGFGIYEQILRSLDNAIDFTPVSDRDFVVAASHDGTERIEPEIKTAKVPGAAGLVGSKGLADQVDTNSHLGVYLMGPDNRNLVGAIPLPNAERVQISADASTVVVNFNRYQLDRTKNSTNKALNPKGTSTGAVIKLGMK